MGKIISIVGVSGVGKTTLVTALSKIHDFATAYESHDERPFQALFKADARYALANQLDYLIYRAEQEQILRTDVRDGIIDGGLDLDFYGFTRLFRARGWLSDSEYGLCRRFYKVARSQLPPPELIVHLQADNDIIRQRLASRERINIATEADAASLESYIEEWLEPIAQDQILRLDATLEDIDYSGCLPRIMAKLRTQKFVTRNSRQYR